MRLERDTTCERSVSSMDWDTKRREQEFEWWLSRLDDAGKAELYLFMSLLIRQPGFRAELKANKPDGENLPTYEVIQALMEKWSLSESA